MNKITNGKMEGEIVMFRLWPEGDVVALFPEIPGDNRGFPYCTAYAHIGQHCGADYRLVIRRTKPAPRKAYRDLLAELRQIGYRNLTIRQRYYTPRQEAP